MGTKLNKVPENEAELNELLQKMYLTAKQSYENRQKCNFTGLFEIIVSEPNIVSAIHKIKSNKGSRTAGVDGKVINDCLEMKYDELLEYVRKKLYDYHPDKVRRVWIPKTGKSELRPLGIPTISDRIIQECVRRVIEPIAEGQFFEHSYGFRPMRSADMAVTRIKKLNFSAKCYWVVEGDIKGFFDNIDHNVMIKSLWSLGIRDKKEMYIGITDINFAKWVNRFPKNQKENPYTPEGRELYNKRMRKRGLAVRVDEVNSSAHALYIRTSKKPIYNFEYFMNRPYTYKRDRGKCKICNGYVEPNESYFHHIDPKLPIHSVNKVKNLITTHDYCHKLIHSDVEPVGLSDETLKRLAKYRKRLNNEL